MNISQTTDSKIFTYVSPNINHKVAGSLCSRLPVILEPVNAVEELFPLLSDPNYHTDFVCISVEMFYQRKDKLDMFDIIKTLATLIKSTVHRSSGSTKSTRARKRDTKILVIVDDTTDPRLVRQIMKFSEINSIGWLLKREEDFQEMVEFIQRLITGDMTPHPKVLELIKPKRRKPEEKKKNINILTVRQAQVLQLVQERGASNKAIAKLLNLSESTVKLHMGAILKKYGVQNRTQLALFSKNQNL
jgi:DNA-binding NarL/FixJ family response regulator